MVKKGDIVTTKFGTMLVKQISKEKIPNVGDWITIFGYELKMKGKSISKVMYKTRDISDLKIEKSGFVVKPLDSDLSSSDTSTEV